MDKQELIEELERSEAFAQVDRSEYWIECGGVDGNAATFRPITQQRRSIGR